MEVFVRERYIPAFIMLVAGAITSLINIVSKVELLTGLKRLLIVIIIFYVIGLIVKAIIHWALIKFAIQENVKTDLEEDLLSEENVL